MTMVYDVDEIVKNYRRGIKMSYFIFGKHGTGKTYLGTRVAEQLGLSYYQEDTYRIGAARLHDIICVDASNYKSYRLYTLIKRYQRFFERLGMVYYLKKDNHELACKTKSFSYENDDDAIKVACDVYQKECDSKENSEYDVWVPLKQIFIIETDKSPEEFIRSFPREYQKRIRNVLNAYFQVFECNENSLRGNWWIDL